MTPVRRSAVMLYVLASIPMAMTEAQSTLTGRVLTEAGAPVPGAVVTLAGIGYSVRTDGRGEFTLSGTPGATIDLRIQAAGFRDDTSAVVLPRRGAVQRDFALVSASAPLPEVNPSDRVLRGFVTSAEGEPLSYANVQLNGGRRYLADDSGRFTLPIAEGAFAVVVRRIGFEPVELKMPAMPDTALRVRLTAVAASLPEQRITGRAAFVALDLRGFYRRMEDAEKGGTRGYFITPEDLAFRKPHNLTQMFEALPGLRVSHSKKSPLYDILRGPNNCVMTVYLDGIMVVKGAFLDADADTSEFVNRIAPVSHVAGVEVYPASVQAPPQYQTGNGRCGVVLIWSK